MASIGNITENFGEESTYLKESDYEEFNTSLDNFGKLVETIRSNTEPLMQSGGLSAEALNFGGFAPLYEMGYNVLNNLSTAEGSLGELKEAIESDAKKHMTAEWGTHLQKCLKELQRLKEIADQVDKDDPTSDDKGNLEAYLAYKKHVDEVVIPRYNELAGEGANENVANIDFEEFSNSGNFVDKNGNPIDELDIPDNFKQTDYYTVTGYDFWCKSGDEMIWTPGTNQEAVSDLWKKCGSRFKNGIAVINVDGIDRYLIATTSTLGNVGDMINCTLGDGTVLPCIIADQKSSGDSNWKPYGHEEPGGDINVIEVEVQRSKYLTNGGSVSTNSWGLDWDTSSPVRHVDNYGSVIDNNNHKYSKDEGAGIDGVKTASIDLSKYKKLAAMSKSNNAVSGGISSKGIENVKNYYPTSGRVTQDAMAWAQKIADDDSYGYSQASRWGETKQFDCSSFVVSAYKNAGIDVGNASYTGNMREELTKCGFEWIPGDPDVNDLVPGDIVLDEDAHTEMYIGNGKLIGAHSNYNGSTGDLSGEEIDVGNYYSHPWDGVLRYTGK